MVQKLLLAVWDDINLYFGFIIEVFIPINSKIKQILNKRNGNFPPAIHENVINKQIKAIARMAQINEAFEIIKTISGKKTSLFVFSCFK